MRFNQLPGNKTSDRIAVSVHNADTVAIPAGAPVVLHMNGTNDGLDVVLPTTQNSALQLQGLRFGVTFKTLQPGDFGEAVVFGFTNTLLLIRQTRAASTAVWNSEASRSVGEYLTILTGASGASNAAFNGFQTVASSGPVVTGSASTLSSAYVIFSPDAVLCQTLNTYASSASTTADSRTALTAAVKAFIRVL